MTEVQIPKKTKKRSKDEEKALKSPNEAFKGQDEESKTNEFLEQTEEKLNNENKKIKLKNQSKKEDKTSASYYLKLYNNSKNTAQPISSNKKFKLNFPTLICPEPIIYVPNDKNNNSILGNKGSSLFYRVSSFISSFDCSNGLIYVGLKSDNKPFNVFERKQGQSKIIVLDIDLNYIQTLTFSYGDIVHIKACDLFIFVLFSNGYLIKIQNVNSIQHKSKSVDHINVAESCEILNFEFSQNLISNDIKAISFDVKNNYLVYTNGATIFCNKKFVQMNMTIIQVLIFDSFVYCLDIQGKIHQFDFELKNKKEIISNYTIEKLMVADNFVLAISREEYYILNIDKKYEMGFFGFFNIKNNGMIYFSKRYKNRRKNVPILQVTENNEEIRIILDSELFESNQKVFIPHLCDFNDFIILAVEDGIIAKIFYC